MRQKRARNPLVYMAINKRAECKKRGIECSITKDDLEYVEHCPALGIKLVYPGRGGTGRGHVRHDSATIDRIDPSKGYVPGNVQIISMKANSIKSFATAEEVQRVADWMNNVSSQRKKIKVSA